MNGDQDSEKKEWVVNYVTEDDNSEKKDDEKENWKKQLLCEIFFRLTYECFGRFMFICGLGEMNITVF